MALSIQAHGIAGQTSVYGEKTQQDGKKSIFAGNLNLEQDPIAQRKKEAREQAMKVVKNAWDSDKSVDQIISDRKKHYATLTEQREQAQSSLSDMDEQEKNLQESYGVAGDSAEQQDLELLKKYQDYKNKVSHEPLTPDELKKLEAINNKPLTEYQTRALEINDRAGAVKLQIKDMDRQMKDDLGDVKSILLEKLKSNPLVDASKTAEQILDAAGKDAVGMAVSQATEHIDEVQEESEKDAQKAADKKEEKEEQLEELKENRALKEAMIEGTKEAVEKAKKEQQKNDAPDMKLGDIIDITKQQDPAEEVKQSLDEIKSSMKLLEADLKGIEVDEQV